MDCCTDPMCRQECVLSIHLAPIVDQNWAVLHMRRGTISAQNYDDDYDDNKSL
jgi:hypothetical protein